jgi:predicted ATP-grasp superfamily ATP-dependent carboligase/protein-tyrosine-phosphatase
MDAIVLDGDQRSALAVTRSLGQRGIRVTVGAETIPSLASRSRFCAGSFEYPSPGRSPDGFFGAVLERARKLPGAVLFPVTDVTMSEILSRKDEFGDGVAIPFDDFRKYRLVSDKGKLVSLCRTLGLPVPRTVLSTDCSDREDLIESAKAVGFPMVVKPSLSRIRTEAGWTSAGVRYARDEGELRGILSGDPFSQFPFIIQERIQGPGVGVFFLMRNGRALARFAHRRIREKPPSGGVSVLCESITPPAGALDAAARLLGELRWNGVAMVEFKIDERGEVPLILEVNARFWGSLQLAVSAGVDFPYLLFRMAKGEWIEEMTRYRTGLKLRWELGDLDHLWIRLARRPSALSLPLRHPTRRAVLRCFVSDFFSRSVKNEVFRVRDPKPFFHELGQYTRRAVASGGRRSGASPAGPDGGPEPIVRERPAPGAAVKKVLKTLYWKAQEPFVSNPPLPPLPRSFLFVCKGNICRSPFAEGMAKRYDFEMRRITFLSAGIAADESADCPREAIVTAGKYGVDLSRHRPRKVDAGMMASHDMIIAMEAWQFRFLRSRFPEHGQKVFLLPLFARDGTEQVDARHGLNIQDPYGRGPEAFSRCFGRIATCLDELFSKVLPQGDVRREWGPDNVTVPTRRCGRLEGGREEGA